MMKPDPKSMAKMEMLKALIAHMRGSMHPEAPQEHMLPHEKFAEANESPEEEASESPEEEKAEADGGEDADLHDDVKSFFGKSKGLPPKKSVSVMAMIAKPGKKNPFKKG